MLISLLQLPSNSTIDKQYTEEEQWTPEVKKFVQMAWLKRCGRIINTAAVNILFLMGSRPLQHDCREIAATRCEIKSRRARNVRRWPWICFAAESKTSARRASKIPIWPALRKTLVFPNCKREVKDHHENVEEHSKPTCRHQVTAEINII